MPTKRDPKRGASPFRLNPVGTRSSGTIRASVMVIPTITATIAIESIPVPSSRAEMLRQLQALRLIVRAEVLPVKRIGPCRELLIDKTPDRLPVLQNERHFMASDFKHGARALAARAGMAEAGIEEARIVHAEFTH